MVLNSGKIHDKKCTDLGSSTASHLQMYWFNLSHLFGTSENNLWGLMSPTDKISPDNVSAM